ncbi:MAG: RDD family protein [Flavitalea sp.]
MDYTLPSFRRRAFAVLVDYILFALCHTLFAMQFGLRTENQLGQPVYEINGYLNIVPVLIWILAFPVMEGFEGMTLGKKITGLKVLKIDGSQYTYLDAFKRRLADWIDFALLGLPAIIISMNTTYHQRLGDLWARTLVVQQIPGEKNQG